MVLRECKKCKLQAITVEELDNFTKDSRRPHGRSEMCKPCYNIRHTVWMKANKDKARLTRKRYNKKKKEQLEEYVGGWKCKHCSFTHTTSAPFDFHHIDPEDKEIPISDVISGTWERIKKEVDKCILLCSNCHRIEHERLRNTNDSYL